MAAAGSKTNARIKAAEARQRETAIAAAAVVAANYRRRNTIASGDDNSNGLDDEDAKLEDNDDDENSPLFDDEAKSPKTFKQEANGMDCLLDDSAAAFVPRISDNQVIYGWCSWQFKSRKHKTK